MAPPKTPHRRKGSCSSSSTLSLLSEAEKLKQKAERTPEGQAREPLLARCCQLLQQVCSIPQHEQEALFDLGDVYALWASSVQASMYETLGSIFSGRLKRESTVSTQIATSQRSLDLYRTSHDMYEKVASRESGEFRQEALVNSANSLCDWADIARELPIDKGGGLRVALDLLKQADTRYLSAFSISPNDVELLVNYGDFNIKRAEFKMQGNDEGLQSHSWVVAKEFFVKALQIYERASNLANASVGDDIAGLLQNWAAGLASFAEMTPDSTEAIAVHEQALLKLRAASKLRPTDTSIFIAIGEICCARAEQVAPLQALELLNVALEEGFGFALRVDAACLDAIIGKAETHFVAGKVAQKMGEVTAAQAHLTQSLNSYGKAVDIIKSGICKLKFEEQCSVVFNFACVASILGQEIYCSEALSLLVNVGGISYSELVGDQDLENVRTKEWFASLLVQSHSQ